MLSAQGLRSTNFSFIGSTQVEQFCRHHPRKKHCCVIRMSSQRIQFGPSKNALVPSSRFGYPSPRYPSPSRFQSSSPRRMMAGLTDDPPPLRLQSNSVLTRTRRYAPQTSMQDTLQQLGGKKKAKPKKKVKAKAKAKKKVKRTK